MIIHICNEKDAQKYYATIAGRVANDSEKKASCRSSNILLLGQDSKNLQSANEKRNIGESQVPEGIIIKFGRIINYIEIHKKVLNNPYIDGLNKPPQLDEISELDKPDTMLFQCGGRELTISYNIQPTIRDIEDLSYDDQILYDKRTFSKYYMDYLLVSQEFFNAFVYKSIKCPAFIRNMLLMTSQSLNFALNAIFYTDSVIQAVSQATQDSSSSTVT